MGRGREGIQIPERFERPVGHLGAISGVYGALRPQHGRHPHSVSHLSTRAPASRSPTSRETSPSQLEGGGGGVSSRHAPPATVPSNIAISPDSFPGRNLARLPHRFSLIRRSSLTKSREIFSQLPR